MRHLGTALPAAQSAFLRFGRGVVFLLPTLRPLLRQGNPHEILTRLHAERQPFYAQAHIRVASESGPHHDTALAIIGAIDQWL